VHGFYRGGLIFRAQLYPDTTVFHSKFNELFFMSRLYVAMGLLTGESRIRQYVWRAGVFASEEAA